jgi:uncharacterized membrane protein YdcZ (DUF606 family)
MTLLNAGLLITCTVFSILLVLGPHLYVNTKNINYLFLTIVTTNLLIGVIYWMYIYRFSTIVVTICGKILPTIALTLISFYITKDSAPTKIKILGLILIVVGIFMLE